MPGPFKITTSRSNRRRQPRPKLNTTERNRITVNPLRRRTITRVNTRRPLGNPSINRTTLQLRTNNLPFLTSFNDKIYESSYTRRKNPSIANIRTLRRGLYPTYSRLPSSGERITRRIIRL